MPGLQQCVFSKFCSKCSVEETDVGGNKSFALGRKVSEKKTEIKNLDAKFHGIQLWYSLSPLSMICAFNKQLPCAQNDILGNSKQEYMYIQEVRLVYMK